MGIIHSKGDYIINLEPDDLLSNETDLEYLYSNTNNSQIDLINYNGFEISSYGYKKEQVYCTLYDEILYKTKLFDHFSRSPDFFIWNKMVKREIFLKAFDDYKHIIDRVYCNYAEDEIWSGLVNKYANSKRCLKRNVYLYIRNSNSLTMRRNNELYCDNLLQWNEMFVFKVFSEKKEMAKAQTIRFLDLIRDTYDYFNSIKSNKLLTEKYIKHLKSIKKEFSDDNLILDKINYLLDAFIPLINTNKKTIR
jgi:sulfur relay (sulfurtransferase) DsrC/TusE family protein